MSIGPQPRSPRKCLSAHKQHPIAASDIHSIIKLEPAIETCVNSGSRRGNTAQYVECGEIRLRVLRGLWAAVGIAWFGGVCARDDTCWSRYVAVVAEGSEEVVAWAVVRWEDAGDRGSRRYRGAEGAQELRRWGVHVVDK